MRYNDFSLKGTKTKRKYAHHAYHFAVTFGNETVLRPGINADHICYETVKSQTDDKGQEQCKRQDKWTGLKASLNT